MGNFSFGEEQIGLTYCMICICMCMNELNFENKLNQCKLTTNKKTVKHKVTQFQLVVTSLFEVKILSFTHC
jgi:hypothetical protein